MKKNLFKSFLMFALVSFAAFSFTSCDPKEDDEPEEILLDGFYISGEATAFTKVDVLGQLKATTVENDNNSTREGLYEIYIALEGGKTFSFTEVAGSTKTVYGPGTGFEAVEQVAGNDEMGATIYKGAYAAGGTFSVTNSGLYHVVVDKQTTTVVIMPVVKWAIIGGATPLGWSDNDMALKGTFNKDSLVFEITDITLLAGDFKFRHSGAWKQTIVAEPLIKVNTNFGGAMDALVPGGANIALAKADQGVYTVTATWSKTAGIKFSMKKTGEAQVAEYPENLYINGGDFGGTNWDWTSAGIVTMNPVHSHPHAFWAIVYSTANSEFKFAPGKEWKGDFGVTGTATEGVYSKGGDNVKVAEAGYYMVYVDLKAEKISVTAPQVYLIGSALGGVWDYAAAVGKFTVDNTNKKIVSPAVQAGELRMYATCPLSQLDTPKADWWQMEFIILDGKIAYRGKGDDQARVQVTAGQVVSLDFTTGNGTIQ